MCDCVWFCHFSLSFVIYGTNQCNLSIFLFSIFLSIQLFCVNQIREICLAKKTLSLVCFVALNCQLCWSTKKEEKKSYQKEEKKNLFFHDGENGKHWKSFRTPVPLKREDDPIPLEMNSDGITFFLSFFLHRNLSGTSICRRLLSYLRHHRRHPSVWGFERVVTNSEKEKKTQ